MKHLLPYPLPIWERYNPEKITLCHTITEKQVEDEQTHETKTMYECETVLVDNEPNKSRIVEALIRERYSVSDELALERQRTSKKAEWTEYNTYCEDCKTIADRVLSNYYATL